MDIKGKRVLLTGASGGIGQCAAQLLAERGARLVLIGRNESVLKEMCQVLGQEHRYLVVDLCAEGALESVEQRWQLEEGVDLLINMAGGNEFALLKDRQAEHIEQELRLDLTVPILLCQQALLWHRPPSLIVNVGSTFGAIGYPGYSSYCAAKAGLHRFSEALDRELAGTGCQVQYFAPRATDTALNSAQVQAMNKQLGNVLDPPEVVANALLASIEQEHKNRWLGWPEKLFVRLNQLFPALVSRAIGKQQIVIQKHAQQTQNLKQGVL